MNPRKQNKTMKKITLTYTITLADTPMIKCCVFDAAWGAILNTDDVIVKPDVTLLARALADVVVLSNKTRLYKNTDRK